MLYSFHVPKGDVATSSKNSSTLERLLLDHSIKKELSASPVADDVNSAGVAKPKCYEICEGLSKNMNFL